MHRRSCFCAARKSPFSSVSNHDSPARGRLRSRQRIPRRARHRNHHSGAAAAGRHACWLTRASDSLVRRHHGELRTDAVLLRTGDRRDFRPHRTPSRAACGHCRSRHHDDCTSRLRFALAHSALAHPRGYHELEHRGGPSLHCRCHPRRRPNGSLRAHRCHFWHRIHTRTRSRGTLGRERPAHALFLCERDLRAQLPLRLLRAA